MLAKSMITILKLGCRSGGTKSGGNISRFKKYKKIKNKQKEKMVIQNQKVFPSIRASTVNCGFLFVREGCFYFCTVQHGGEQYIYYVWLCLGSREYSLFDLTLAERKRRIGYPHRSCRTSVPLFSGSGARLASDGPTQ